MHILPRVETRRGGNSSIFAIALGLSVGSFNIMPRNSN
jgi:hypothetical protein